MWILGNLFSKNPTILYTIDDKKEKKQNDHRQYNEERRGLTTFNGQQFLIEDPEHVRKYFGMDY